MVYTGVMTTHTFTVKVRGENHRAALAALLATLDQADPDANVFTDVVQSNGLRPTAAFPRAFGRSAVVTGGTPL